MKYLLLVCLIFLLPCSALTDHESNCFISLKTIYANEGGFQALRGDSGNWTGGKVGKGVLRGTKYGICAASYPKLDIKNLTLAQASLLYERDYWKPLHLNLIKSQWLATMFLDTAVNCGTGTAAILITRSINVLNGKEEDYPTDPELGSKEIDWLNNFTQTKWYESKKDTSARALFGSVFKEMRTRYYVKIVQLHPDKLHFLPVWIARVYTNV